MKNIIHTLGCSTLITLVGIQAGWAQDNQAGRFFARMNLGAAVAEDVKVQRFANVPGTRGLNLELNPGLSMDIAGGFQVTDWFAAELQTGFTANYIDRMKGAPNIYFHDSSLSTVPMMVNAVFQYPNRTGLIPYAGAGVGGSINVFNADNIVAFYGGPFHGIPIDGSDSDAVFCYQFFGGLRYRINPQMEINIGYKYSATKDSSWDVDFYDYYYYYGPVGDISLDGMSIHSATVSFLFRF